jgi:flavin-dependent dehydrogenase
MSTAECDVLVIGGGPGGSTISALLARKGRKVIQLEKDRHPRFHIGESLLPMNMPILERLGVMATVKEMGVVKLGADFSLGAEDDYVVYQFAHAFGDSPGNAYEVTRSEFDEMLFRHAAACGADSREGVRVERVDWDAPDGSGLRRVTAEAAGPGGEKLTFRAKYLVDASGRDTFLSKKLSLKRRNPSHGSAAIFSHFKGVVRRPGAEQGNISIYWFDHGWMWFIPLRDDVMSIGCVCDPAYLKSQKGTNEETLMATLRLAPAGFARLANAERIAPVRATGNYSYTSDRMAGPGFVMVGDAFAFIDPVFSSGVYLAMNGAEQAAVLVDEVLRHPEREAALQRAYEKRMRRGIGMFSWFIYRFNSPGLRWIFRHPRNVYRIQEAVTSMLAGDVFQNSEIDKRFHALKFIYAFRSIAELGSFAKSLRARMKNARTSFDQGTLAVDREGTVDREGLGGAAGESRAAVDEAGARGGASQDAPN